MVSTDVIQNELAVLKTGPSMKEAAAAVARIQKAIWDKVRSEAGRHSIGWDLLSVVEFLGTASTARRTTRRQLAYGMVEVLEPLAALETKADDYEYARQETYLIDRLTEHLVEKLQLVREFYPTEGDDADGDNDGRGKFTTLPVRPNYLMTEAADLMIRHAVATILRQTMRDKFMATAIYGIMAMPAAGIEWSGNAAFNAVAKKFMPRFRQNATEVVVAWHKVTQRYGWADVFEMEGKDGTERAAIDIVRAMQIEAKIFGVFLPKRVDLNLIGMLTQISRPGLVESLKDIASATDHEDGEPYLRRMLERVNNRSLPLESDLVMLAALHMPDPAKRLPIQAANGSCIGSCRSRKEMLAIRSILAGELQRLPGECIELLNGHRAGDRMTEESLEAVVRLALDLVINLSRARFEPEVKALEEALRRIDTSGKIAKWLQDTRLQSDIDPMTEILLASLDG